MRDNTWTGAMYSAIAISLLVVAFALGGGVARSRMLADCEDMGMLRLYDSVWTCTKVK